MVQTRDPANLQVLAFMIDHHLKTEKALAMVADQAGYPHVAVTLERAGPARRRELAVTQKQVLGLLDGK